MKNNKYLVVYYLVLVLLLVFYQSLNEPALVFRLGFLAAIIAPTFFNRECCYPAILVMFLTIGNYSFAYNYMPNMLRIYVIITLIVLPILLVIKGKIAKDSVPVFLVVFPFYILIVEVITTNMQPNVPIMQDVFFCFLLLMFFLVIIGDDIEPALKQMPICFTVATISLSFLFLTHQSDYTNSYNLNAELDRIGWGDANYFGMVLGLGTVTGLIKIFDTKWRDVARLEKALYLTAVVVSIPVLLLNASRGAVLSVLVSFMVLMFFSKVKTSYKILVIVLSAIALVYLYNNQYMDLLEYRLGEDSAATGAGRTEIWKNKLQAFWGKNVWAWMFGLGYYGGCTINGYFWGFHNDYLAFLIDYGFIGLGLFLYMLYYPFKVLPHKSSTFSSVLAIIIYLAVCFLTLEPFTFGKITYFAFYMYAVLIARKERKLELATK